MQSLDRDHFTTYKLKVLENRVIDACKWLCTQKGVVSCDSHRRYLAIATVSFYLKTKQTKKPIKSECMIIYELDLIFSEYFYYILL